VCVPNAEHFESPGFERLLSFLIKRFLADVALSVKFDDESGPRTVKVRNVTGNGCLAPELAPGEPTAA
jgi:hypothetical protein